MRSVEINEDIARQIESYYFLLGNENLGSVVNSILRGAVFNDEEESVDVGIFDGCISITYPSNWSQQDIDDFDRERLRETDKKRDERLYAPTIRNERDKLKFRATMAITSILTFLIGYSISYFC